MVNLTQALLKYVLYVLEIRRATRVGGAIAPPWEEKPIYSFYIELSTGVYSIPSHLRLLTWSHSICRTYHLSHIFCYHVHIPFHPHIRHSGCLCRRQSVYHQVPRVCSVQKSYASVGHVRHSYTTRA